MTLWIFYENGDLSMKQGVTSFWTNRDAVHWIKNLQIAGHAYHVARVQVLK